MSEAYSTVRLLKERNVTTMMLPEPGCNPLGTLESD